jgi:hypothetical protein
MSENRDISTGTVAFQAERICTKVCGRSLGTIRAARRGHIIVCFNLSDIGTIKWFQLDNGWELTFALNPE